MEEQRRAVVEEAKSWIGTPYHHMGRLKGVGVDCATILLEVYHAAGVIPLVTLEHYPPDWMLHQSEERYLEKIKEAGGVEFAGPPQVGDLIVVKFGRCYSHGAIVLEWPLCIHAQVKQKVGYVDVVRDSSFYDKKGERRPFKFFTLWPEG